LALHQTTEQVTAAASSTVVDVSFSGKAGGFSLDVSFASSRERVVLFGPSGSGKSLTLRTIAGIFHPRQSRIVIKGMTLEDTGAGTRLRPNSRRVGYVPQGYALFPHMSARKNILYSVSHLPASEQERRLQSILKVVDLVGFAHSFPRQLSGGQQQRVALARALVGEPLVLLDEPFAAIDTPLRAGLRMELAAIQAATSTAMITVTHDLDDAFALGDWIVVVDDGRVLQQGVKDDVYRKPATRKVAELVGFRNIVPAVVSEASERWVTFGWSRQVLSASAAGREFIPGQRVDACIRAAQIMIRRPGDAAFEERTNTLAGVIVDEAITAETRRLFVRLHGSQQRFDLEIHLPEYTYFRLGLDVNKDVEMSVKPEAIQVLPA
jgi:molybdate transport system ATP-binding protein